MGLFDRFRKTEKRSTGSEPFWRRLFGDGSKVDSVVTPLRAMQTSAVYACVKLISETIAALPFPVYKNTPDGKQRAVDYPLYRLLQERPNPEQIAIQFREMMMANLLLGGDAYAEIVYESGQPVALWPLPSWCVEPMRDANYELFYQVTIPRTNESKQLAPYYVFRVPGFAIQGDKGLSPLAAAARAINLSQAAESFGYDFFSNGTNIGSVVSTPAALSDKAFDRLKTDLRDKYEGLGKSHRLMLLEEGMKFEKNVIPPNDAQFLETRKFQLTDIARIFRVPPHMVGDLERATFSNIEQQDLFFVKHTILPYLRRWEQAVHEALIPEELRRVYYAEHNVEGLLRGDIASRYRSYAIGRQWGWLSVNDIRFLENLNKVEDGDEYLKPLNMVPLGADTTPQADNGKGGGGSET